MELRRTVKNSKKGKRRWRLDRFGDDEVELRHQNGLWADRSVARFLRGGGHFDLSVDLDKYTCRSHVFVGRSGVGLEKLCFFVAYYSILLFWNF